MTARSKPDDTRRATATAAGYSGTPLVRKLGLKDSSRLLVINEPPDYRSLVGELPPGLGEDSSLNAATTVVHLFVRTRVDLSAHLGQLRKTVAPAAAIWVSWPKKASKVPTDITEDTIRELALPLGLVDVKVCAVSAVWSGLKLVIRKELRGSHAAESGSPGPAPAAGHEPRD